MALEERIRGKYDLAFLFLLLGFSLVLSNSPVSTFIGLKDDLLAAQVDTRSTKAQLEG